MTSVKVPLTCKPDEYSQVAILLHSLALLIPSNPPTEDAIVLANSSNTSRRWLKSRQTKSCGCLVVISKAVSAASIEYGIFLTLASRQETDSPMEESNPAP